MQSEPQCQLIVNLNSWTNLQGFTSQCAVATSIYKSLISGINKWCIHRNMNRGQTSCKRVNFRILQVLFCILNGNLQKVECMRAHFLCRRKFFIFFSSHKLLIRLSVLFHVHICGSGSDKSGCRWKNHENCMNNSRSMHMVVNRSCAILIEHLFEAEENKKKHSMLVHECFCVLWRHVVR